MHMHDCVYLIIGTNVYNTYIHYMYHLPAWCAISTMQDSVAQSCGRQLKWDYQACFRIRSPTDMVRQLPYAAKNSRLGPLQLTDTSQ